MDVIGIGFYRDPGYDSRHTSSIITITMLRRPSLWQTLVSTTRRTLLHDTPSLSATAALVSPQQRIDWSYAELQRQALSLSRELQRERGVGAGSLVFTNLPNVAEGILLQLACSRLGAIVVTAKDANQLATIVSSNSLTSSNSSIGAVQCAVVAPPPATTQVDAANLWVYEHTFSTPHIVAGSEEMNSMLDSLTHDKETTDLADEEENGATNIDVQDTPLAYFGTSKALTQNEIWHQGQEMVDLLSMTQSDRVCVSISLYHAFGIGSACSAAFQSGSAIVLPAVGGLQGCGVPSQRATVTLQTMVSEQCTLLFADTHTLRALHEEPLCTELNQSNLSNHLRGGVCKTGSGSEILSETVDLAGVRLATLGKRK